MAQPVFAERADAGEGGVDSGVRCESEDLRREACDLSPKAEP